MKLISLTKDRPFVLAPALIVKDRNKVSECIRVEKLQLLKWIPE
ncbi:MAG: hypothetical protein ABIA75_01155 [Candidatus Neomarinimicrobiota bacterium]